MQRGVAALTGEGFVQRVASGVEHHESGLQR